MLVLLGAVTSNLSQCSILNYQGIDGPVPVLVQDTDYMVEKNYYLKQYLGPFGAYLMPLWTIEGSKGIPIYQLFERGGQLIISSIWSTNY